MTTFVRNVLANYSISNFADGENFSCEDNPRIGSGNPQKHWEIQLTDIPDSLNFTEAQVV